MYTRWVECRVDWASESFGMWDSESSSGDPSIRCRNLWSKWHYLNYLSCINTTKIYASVVKSQPFRTKVFFRFLWLKTSHFYRSAFRCEKLEKNTIRQIFSSRGVEVHRDTAVVPLKRMCLVSWQIQQHNRLFLCVFITFCTSCWLRSQQEQRTDCTHLHCRRTRTLLVRRTPRMIMKIISFARQCPRGAHARCVHAQPSSNIYIAAIGSESPSKKITCCNVMY